MKRIVHIFLLLMIGFLLLGGKSYAQMPVKIRVKPTVEPDTADLNFYGKKHFWRAAGEVVGFNLGLWAFDRYVQHGDWAYINFHTIKENFRHGFIWDNDLLGTNTFLHPYNGNLYYTAGRANGFNYWQSELFAIAGSGMWELFMEREYPSTNDFIATPIGGAAIGETLFRASDAVLDDSSRGWERFGREIAGFVLSPMRGINRIITGQAWHWRPTTGRLFGRPNIALQVSLGLKMMEFQGRMRKPFFGGSMQIDLEYGDRFEARSTKPYDYFTVKAEIQALKYQPVLNQLQIKGRLLSREIFDNYRSSGTIGLYQHFDFYDSDTIRSLDNKVPYKLGIPASLGAGFLFRDVDRGKFVFDAYAHANAIILGGILSDHYKEDERNYNWGSGFSLKGGFHVIWDHGKFTAQAMNEYYRMFTWKGYRQGIDLEKEDFHTLNVQGDKSVAFFNVTEVRLDYRIMCHLYGTFIFKNQLRHTRYRDFPDVASSTMDFRLMATYKF